MRKILTGALFLLTVYRAHGTTSDPYDVVNSSWDRFGAVYGHVLEHYYNQVGHDELMRSAIDGLLRELDSYSQFFDEEGLRQLRQDTTGRFAGLGITVGTKDNYPVVIAPIEGTPAQRAGLQPGDLIVAVDGSDTFGLSLEEVVVVLRGEPGSSVRVTIARIGALSNWDVELVREIITIKTVSVADLVTPKIGYISMRQTRFSEDTAAEVELALRELAKRGASRFILDLRGNPGGLLTQATHVADLFLPKGSPIVSIRERGGLREQTRFSQADEVVADPMVVLVDGGSASAAEIVAGAIQDNDRGLVVGSESFGKGSVQTIFNLGELEHGALKLTTALYHTPSGRSIHRNSLRRHSGLLTAVAVGGIEVPAAVLVGSIVGANSREEAADWLRARFDLGTGEAEAILETPLAGLVNSPRGDDTGDQVEELTIYYTANGREVYGGGGITPDIIIEAVTPPAALADLFRGRVFFDFIVDYIGSGNGEPDSLSNEVDSHMMDTFLSFLPRIDEGLQQSDSGLEKVEALRQLATEGGWGEHAAALLDSLAVLVTKRQEPLSEEAEQYIRHNLRRELTLRLQGKRASLLASLEGDPQMTEAVSLLSDASRYRNLLGEN